MTNSCYFLVYIFETLISYIYFSNKYTKKISNIYAAIIYVSMFIIQYVVNFIAIPNIKLIVFLITNLIVCYFCYKSNLLQSLFNSFILVALMLTTELCIFYFSKLIFNTSITEYSTNELVLLIQAASSKLLYFLIAFIVSKISIKEKKLDFKFTKVSFLFILPIASILLLIGVAYITENYNLNNYVYLLFSISTILLIYSNILVFLVYNSIIKTQLENIELHLQNQKTEIDSEYYSILQKQYDNSSILIHDIKRHLLSIKELSVEKNYSAIIEYIDNLYDNNQIDSLKKYSSNKLVNVIINRYSQLCDENNIKFFCDIRNIDFSFLSDNDLTSILDNLLENSVEASLESNKKNIELTIMQKNTNFIVINIWNYYNKEPQILNGKFLTSKKDKNIHGFGINSIERIVKKYNGDFNYHFDKNNMTCTFSIILKNQYIN